jgi:hypothetical protein
MPGFLDTIKANPAIALAPAGALAAYLLDRQMNAPGEHDPGEAAEPYKPNWLYPIGGALLGAGIGSMLGTPAGAGTPGNPADVMKDLNTREAQLSREIDAPRRRIGDTYDQTPAMSYAKSFLARGQEIENNKHAMTRWLATLPRDTRKSFINKELASIYSHTNDLAGLQSEDPVLRQKALDVAETYNTLNDDQLNAQAKMYTDLINTLNKHK